MRTLLVGLVLLLAQPLVAQESYSFTAEHVVGVDFRRVEHNAAVCTAHRLAPTCSQSDLDLVPGSVGTIYPDSQRGRNDFAVEVLFGSILTGAVSDQAATAEREREQDLKDRCEALDRDAKDRLCAELGLPSGCDPCPAVVTES